jgi:hypothetical protein
MKDGEERKGKMVKQRKGRMVGMVGNARAWWGENKEWKGMMDEVIMGNSRVTLRNDGIMARNNI